MLLLSLLTAVLSPSPAQARVDPWFSRDVQTAELAAGELGRAQRSVDLMLPDHDLKERWLIDALSAEGKAGREVRLVVGAGPAGAAAAAACAELKAAGVKIREAQEPVRERFAIVDGPRGRLDAGDAARLLVFTGNLAGTGDGALLRFTTEGDYVLAYAAEFQKAWSQAAGRLKKAPAPLVVFGGPGDAALPLADYLAGAIDQAYNTIDISAHTLRRGEIYGALRRAAARGVKIRVLLDGRAKWLGNVPTPGDCQATYAKEILSPLFPACLTTSGADVRYAMTKARKNARVQSSYAVIDGKKLLFGVPAAAEQGEQSLVDVRSAATAAAFADHFERWFRNSEVQAFSLN